MDEDVMGYSSGLTYYNAIRAYSNVLQTGMKPLVELSFTPNPIASSSSTCFHYKGQNSPPKNLTSYGEYIKGFAQATGPNIYIFLRFLRSPCEKPGFLTFFQKFGAPGSPGLPGGPR